MADDEEPAVDETVFPYDDEVRDPYDDDDTKNPHDAGAGPGDDEKPAPRRRGRPRKTAS